MGSTVLITKNEFIGAKNYPSVNERRNKNMDTDRR